MSPTWGSPPGTQVFVHLAHQQHLAPWPTSSVHGVPRCHALLSSHLSWGTFSPFSSVSSSTTLPGAGVPWDSSLLTCSSGQSHHSTASPTLMLTPQFSSSVQILASLTGHFDISEALPSQHAKNSSFPPRPAPPPRDGTPVCPIVQTFGHS